MTWILLAGLLLTGTPAVEVKRVEQQIHESLMALPEALRADATEASAVLSKSSAPSTALPRSGGTASWNSEATRVAPTARATRPR